MQAKSQAHSILSKLVKTLGFGGRDDAGRRPGESTLYLHIGTHKTGTSALQLFLSRNRARLAMSGLVYPETGCTPEGAHHYIANSLKGPPFPVLKPEKTAAEYLDELRCLARNHPSVLISSEIFMRLLPSFGQNASPDLSDLERLGFVADRVRPIVYFRPQEDYLESFYRQTILDQLKLTPEEFVERRYLNYLSVCEDLEQVFGRENLIVKTYDRNRFPDGSLFADFLSIFSIGLTDEFTESDLHANPSFVPDAIEFRRLLNCLGATLHDARSFNAALGAYSKQEKSGGSSSGFRELFFSPDVQQAIRDKSAGINEHIGSAYLQSGSFFPPENVESQSTGEASVYHGLNEAGLDSLLDYMRVNSPELIELLGKIMSNAAVDRPDARAFAQMLSKRL